MGSSTGDECCRAAVADDGAGFVSMLFDTAVGSASSACRNPVLIKSRCFWDAVRFVRMSECSSDPCAGIV